MYPGIADPLHTARCMTPIVQSVHHKGQQATCAPLTEMHFRDSQGHASVRRESWAGPILHSLGV